MKRLLLLSWLLVLFLPRAVLADDVYILKYLFKETEVRYKNDLVMKIKVTPITFDSELKKNHFDLSMKAKLLSTDTLKEINTDGNLTISTKLSFLKMNLNSMGKKIKMNFGEGDTDGVMEVTTQINPSGKVLKTESFQSPALQNKKEVDTGMIEKNLNYEILPDRPVKIGDTWTIEMKIPLGENLFSQGEELTFPISYTFTKIKKIRGKRCAILDASGSTTLALNPDEQTDSDQSTVPEKTKVTFSLLLTFKSEEIFNIEDGCVERSKIDLKGSGLVSTSNEESRTSFDMLIELVAKSNVGRIY